MKWMELDDIVIKDSFASTVPRKEKIAECRQHWDMHHNQDRYIVVNHSNVLIDGYIQYLILKEQGIKMAEVQISDKCRKRWVRKNRRVSELKVQKKCDTTYIYGIHPNSKNKKERVWRVPKNWKKGWENNLNVGDMVLVKTKNGLAPVEVTKIERLSECPVGSYVNTVVRKLNNL